LKRVALSDVRKLFRDDGTMKPPNEWDDDTAAAIASVDVEEIWDGRGEGRKQIGVTKRVKLWSKSDALRMAMELFGISQKPTLETILLLLPVDVATLLRAAIASCPAPGVPPVRDLPGGVAGDPGDGPLDRPAQAIPQ
jgi:phage terminase small subunit